MTVVNLYAGSGGWEAGAAALGLDLLGIELDADACATRRAAGLATIRADLHHYRPPPRLQLDGLIASPPCQVFSQAGHRKGVRAMPDLLAALDAADWGWPALTQFPPDARLLWVVYDWWRRHRPRWVALEQVRTVLPFWEAVAARMRRSGWHAWTGLVDAADYGVPQNRTRAILLAHRDRHVDRPEPTHARAPEPTLFGELAPWVTMAQALGWDGVVDQARGPAFEREPRPVERPAPTVTSKSNRWVLNRREGERNRERALDRPAPTLTLSAVERNWVWDRPSTTVACDSRIQPPGHKINAADIARLGQAEAEHRYHGRSGRDAVKVTPAQAAALQTFPPGWPFVGTKTSQARQIGNAVPALLAYHLLRSVVDAA